MRRKINMLVLCLILSVVSTGCQRMLTPNQPGSPSANISAAKDKSDFYLGVITGDVGAQTGMNGSTPTTYKLSNGTIVRIIGKSDGNYVAVLPNNQIGLIPINSSKPVSPPTTQPVPIPSTPSGGGTAINQGTPPVSIPGTSPAASSGTSGAAVSPEISSMVNLVNQVRGQAGLKALNSNGSLASLARLKATDIVNKNYFSHTSPTYGSPFDMMKKYGVSYLYAGENLAINQNVQSAQQALMNSPQHKANILSPNFTDIGVGISQKSNGSRVYVQMFIGR